MNWREIPTSFFYFLMCRNYREVISMRNSKEGISHFILRNGIKIYSEKWCDACWLFEEIWMRQIYTRRYSGREPSVIVDIGANVGMFTLLAKCLWPTCKVHCYEPVVENFESLKVNIKSNCLEDVDIVCRAVADSRGESVLYIKRTSGLHTLYPSMNGSTIGAQIVASVDIEGVLERSGWRVDFLKVDCEGGEWPLLLGSAELLRGRVGYIAMEYHEIGGRKWEDMVETLEGAGMECFVEAPNCAGAGMIYAWEGLCRD